MFQFSNVSNSRLRLACNILIQDYLNDEIGVKLDKIKYFATKEFNFYAAGIFTNIQFSCTKTPTHGQAFVDHTSI